VLEHTQILNVGARIQDSLIGREAIVQHTVRRPATLQMHLGDYSQVDLP